MENSENVNPNDATIKTVKLRGYDIKVKPSASFKMVPQEVRTPKSKKRRFGAIDNPAEPSCSTAPPQNNPLNKKQRANENTVDDTGMDDLSIDFPGFELSPGALVDIQTEVQNMLAARELCFDIFDEALSGGDGNDNINGGNTQSTDLAIPGGSNGAESGATNAALIPNVRIVKKKIFRSVLFVLFCSVVCYFFHLDLAKCSGHSTNRY